MGHFKRSMASTWTSASVKFVLPILLLTFPFGIILAILLRLPVEDLTMASTDMYPLTQLSDFWCGWQQVVSTHPFYAYKTSGPLNPTDTFTHNLAFRFALRKRRHHILRYYLLTGSSLFVSGCSSDPGAWLDVVEGQSLHRCLNHEIQQNSISDSSESQEDSDETVVDFRKCPGSLLNSELAMSGGRSDEIVPTCGSTFGGINTIPTTKTGIYYVVVKSDSAELNNILIHLALNRTIFDLPDDMILCRSETSCDIPLTYGASERVVVVMSPEPDAGNVVFPVQSKCKPRTVFYVLSTALIPAFFVIVLWMAFIHVRKKRYGNRVVFVLSPEREASPARSPLLKEVTPEMNRFEDPPPPYCLEGDVPPPPYDVQQQRP